MDKCWEVKNMGNNVFRKSLVIVIIAWFIGASLSITPNMFIKMVKADPTSDNIIFSDDFESYTVGTFPSIRGWQIVWNGAGNQYQMVTDTYSSSPTKSLQLMGSYGWSVVVKKDFSSSSNLIGYEAYIMASSNGEPICVSFFNQYIETWGRYYANIEFASDGYIWACEHNLEVVHQLQSYTPYTWYKIRVVVDKTARLYDVWIDDVLKGHNIPILNDPNEILSIHLQVAWVNHKNYFDDVKVFSVSQNQPPSEGLVGYWNFDEGSGNIAVDISGNGNTGILVNNPAWVDGKSGKALSFNGIDNYVHISDSSSLDVTSQITLETWVFPRSYVDYTGMVSHMISRSDYSGGPVYVLAMYPDNHKVNYDINFVNTYHQSNAEIQLNTWTHLAVTYDGSNVRFYINGEFDSSYAYVGSISTTSNWLAIGCKPTDPYGGVGTYAYFNGIIDEVKIYNRALSQQEIQTDLGELHVQDVAVLNVIPQQTYIVVGESLPINVVVQNLGTQTESFSVTAYYGTGEIGFYVKDVTLNAGDVETLNMVWDTAGVFPNCYVIGAYASHLPSETNLNNNNYIDGTVVVMGLPYKPTNIKAELELFFDLFGVPFSKVKLTWSAPTGDTPSSYYVFRGTSSDNVEFTAETTETLYKEFFPDVKEVYYYRVSAVFPEGQSILSDAVPISSLEGVNGIENEVYLWNIIALVWPFTIQQNFKIPWRGWGHEGYYWIQNVLYVSEDWMAGQIQIFNYTKISDGSYKSTSTVLGKDFPIITSPPFPFPGGFMTPVVLRATIDGTELSIENPCLLEFGGQPFTFEVPEGSFISSGWTFNSIQPFSQSAEIVLVSNPYQQLISPVYFLGGSGKVNSYVRHSTSSINKWYLCDNNMVVQQEYASTGEKSIGLQWASNGNFQHADVSDQGLWFAPSYDLPITVPDVVPTNPIDYLVIAVMCPVYLDLFDAHSNMCGYNITSGLIENQIPSAICFTNQTIFVTQTYGRYIVKLIGTSDGEYHLNLKSVFVINSTIDQWVNGTITTGQTIEYHIFVGESGIPIIDDTPPFITIEIPSSWEALQDGVTLRSLVTDTSGVDWVHYSIRTPGGFQGTIINPTYESIPSINNTDDKWELLFDTTQLPDGFYVLYVNATDILGNEGNTTVNFSIRNWAVLELLPNTANNKAGRTIPVKFSLRISSAVNPAQPFVRNEELTLKIYEKGHNETILQTSTYGFNSTDYRINSTEEQYITNFKTLSTPKTYIVEIWRNNLLIGSFEFKTVK